MKTSARLLTLLAATVILLPAAALSQSPQMNGVTGEDLKAASERIRETGLQMQKDIQERLQKIRRERIALANRQTLERRQEAEHEQRQAEIDKAALAATRETKQREALAAAQEKARRENATRLAELERVRQIELKEKADQEAELERAQQESLDSYKAGSKKQKLGSEAQFGIDL